MSLPLAVGLVLLGLLLLAGGGELLVRGAVALARHAGLTPAVIGLTIVALGTSLPEMVVSILAATRGQPDIAVANVVGSNICNVALILGVGALVAPLPIRSNVVRLEWPVMFLATLGALLVARDGLIDRLEALVLLTGLTVFVGWSVRIARQEVADGEADLFALEVAGHSLRPRQHELLFSGLAVMAGLLLLLAGGRALVDGAVRLAQIAGMSERVIGLTIVAIGTSAPELATTVVAAMRRQTDLAVGNIIGSNVFNLLGILGVGGLIMPLSVSPAILGSDVWWMLGTSAVIFPMMRLGMRISRADGALLFGTYVVYLILLMW